MEVDFKKGRAFKALVRRLCFIAFGVSAMADSMNLLNLYNIGFGVFIGLFFGGLFRITLKLFLAALNGSLRAEKGKGVISYAVDNGMLFLTPFAVMILIAKFYLNWSMTMPFISAGIMAAGTAAAIEVGRLQDKQSVKNTIATSVVSFAYSLVWTMSFSILSRAPGLIEVGVGFLRSLLGGRGI